MSRLRQVLRLVFIFGSIILHLILFPFEHQIYGAINSNTEEWKTILTFVLPFDQLQPVVYEVIWIFESWALFITFCIYMCTDLIFAILTQILSMEFDILGQVISEIDMIDGEDEAIKELKKLIDIHQELINASEDISHIFSELLLINSCGAIVIICLSSFLSVVSIISFIVIIKRDKISKFMLLSFSQELADSLL